MTLSWKSAWEILETNSSLTRRDGQQRLGDAIFSNVFERGQLVGEAPTGTGKSITALVPAIMAVKEKSHRTILTTETLSLLDQIIDKDLPFLHQVYGGFTYFGLKGRNHYFCGNKAGNDPIALQVRDRLVGTNGERRDVEKVLGYRMDDYDWSLISSDTEFCSHNRCEEPECYSARARNRAMGANIVITSHAMLQVHGEFIQSVDDDGLLGKFEHIIVDEAHSLENVVVNGSTMEFAPWDISTRFTSISKGIQKLDTSKYAGSVDQVQRDVSRCIQIIQTLFEYQAGKDMSPREWARQSFALAEVYIMAGDLGHEMALDEYETVLPNLAAQCSTTFTDLAKQMGKDAIKLASGKGAVNKAITACGYMASLFKLIGESIVTKNGTTEAYGTTYALFADGLQNDYLGKVSKRVMIRAVPLDVSGFLKRNLWDHAFSVTAISATLRDQTDGSFRFLKRSLGMNPDAKELVVDSPFDFAKQQLIYLTKESGENVIDVPGAKFSMTELRGLLDATQGRSLVLFTAMSELQYVATQLRHDKAFPYSVLVQEQGADKAELAKKFKEDTSSVLLASKSFFQGFDVPGEALTSVVLVKFSNPRYDATMKALLRHWRERGFPRFYEMKAMETFVQAFGRGVRSADCKAVCSLLDHRVSDETEAVHKSVHHVLGQSYAHSEVTSDISYVRQWLGG